MSAVNPLTGEMVQHEDQLERRPIAVKISNAPALVRPQAGLNDADIIFEHLVEGGFTRFTAIFYGKDAPLVGSIRSPRIIDFEIPLMYDAAFAFSSGHAVINREMQASPYSDRLLSPAFGSDGFYRLDIPERLFEHTLFTDVDSLRSALVERGEDVAPDYEDGMWFSAEIPPNSNSATTFTINYPRTVAEWRYNTTTNQYERWTDGEPHFDANYPYQLAVSNVIVIYAAHAETSLEQDILGNRSLAIELMGRGSMRLFRDGRAFEGDWARPTRTTMLLFFDKDGEPLPLAIGSSFFQIVPQATNLLTIKVP